MKSTPDKHPIIEFYSSVGGVAFLQGLMREWRSAGFEVYAKHTLTEIEYKKQRSVFGRWVVRFRMYLEHAFRCAFVYRNSRGRPVIRVVSTNPFFAPCLVKYFSGKDVFTVNLLYDLYPDALILSGIVTPRSLVARCTAACTRFALKQSDATVFLGERLKAYTERIYGPARRAATIAVGADGEPFVDSPPSPCANGSMINILYAGQMGKMHDVDTLFSMINIGLPAEISLSIYSGGTGFSSLLRKLKSRKRITLGGYLSDAEWQKQMKLAHISIVSLSEGAEHVVMPSKTYAAMAAGQAIIAICPPRSDLADLVIDCNCGWVVPLNDVGALARLLTGIVQDRTELNIKRSNAFREGQLKFDIKNIANEWIALFADLLRSKVG